MDLEMLVDDIMRQPPTRDTILSALRTVWNTRGTADAKQVGERAITLMGTSGGGVYAEHFVRAIHELDE